MALPMWVPLLLCNLLLLIHVYNLFLFYSNFMEKKLIKKRKKGGFKYCVTLAYLTFLLIKIF